MAAPIYGWNPYASTAKRVQRRGDGHGAVGGPPGRALTAKEFFEETGDPLLALTGTFEVSAQAQHRLEAICARCKTTFSEASNVGHWECRFHPGAPAGSDHDQNRQWPMGAYSCCGFSDHVGSRLYSSKYATGCTRCDHSVDGSNPRLMPDISVDASSPFIEPPITDAVVSTTSESIERGAMRIFHVVRRFDWHEVKIRLRYGLSRDVPALEDQLRHACALGIILDRAAPYLIPCPESPFPASMFTPRDRV
jgi:hypothetical protein